MRKKPKTCQGCKFFLDSSFVVSDYTPYFSIAHRGKVETLLNSGDYGRCIKHSQMFPDTEFQENLPTKNLIVVSSAVSVCVVVKWLWKCDDWEDKKSEDKIRWEKGKEEKPQAVIAAGS